MDDSAAADYLKNLKTQINSIEAGKAKVFPLPNGLGEVIMKEDGVITTKPASKALIVRGSKKSRRFIASAFPILKK